MTGPEHYAEAQRILNEDVDYSQPDDVALVLAHAQVHATLALVAAAAENDAETGKSSAQCIAWERVIA